MKKNRLILIKTIHTIIWLFFVCTIFYILYSGIFNIISLYLWIAIGLIVFEGVVLLIFKWRCPLTIIAYKFSPNHEDGFDIFLPRWLAKNNKIIFTTIFIIGLLLIIYRCIS